MNALAVTRTNRAQGNVPETPALLGISNKGQRLELQVEGTPGEHYQIRKSNDLTRWTTVTNIVALSAAPQTYDPGPSDSPAAFYQANWIPH